MIKTSFYDILEPPVKDQNWLFDFWEPPLKRVTYTLPLLTTGQKHMCILKATF
jgi:hypothetical protein